MCGKELLTEGCMGWQANLPFVNLGGTAVAISVGSWHACAILVSYSSVWLGFWVAGNSRN
jgi:hypothetical protein